VTYCLHDKQNNNANRFLKHVLNSKCRITHRTGIHRKIYIHT